MAPSLRLPRGGGASLPTEASTPSPIRARPGWISRRAGSRLGLAGSRLASGWLASVWLASLRIWLDLAGFRVDFGFGLTWLDSGLA